MTLPMMNHQRSRMKMIPAFDTPLFEQACSARCKPKVFKLSGLQDFFQWLVQRQVQNGLQQSIQQVLGKLCWNQQITRASHVHHGKLSEHHANVGFALVMTSRGALTSIFGLHRLDQESQHLL
jgi:hypothetical protein